MKSYGQPANTMRIVLLLLERIDSETYIKSSHSECKYVNSNN